MIQLEAKILSHLEVAPDCFLLELEAAVMAKLGVPGQFVHLRVTDSDIPLLRRPFSLHRFQLYSIEILYRIKGEGTRLLSQRNKGERIDLIGPLGNGFDLASIPQDKLIILIGGGSGMAPLLGLADKLSRQFFKEKIIFLLGARSQELLLRRKEIQNLGIECFFTTEDGSYGERGMVTQLFERKLKSWGKSLGVVFACGPKAMLKVLGNLSQQFKFPGQVSLEENMACGLGACLGCVVRVSSSGKIDKSFENKRVCRDGPIFKIREVIFE